MLHPGGRLRRQKEVGEQAIEQDAKFDGVWVLRTNTDLETECVARAYKGLGMVRDPFRTAKSNLAKRPIYHKCDETIRGNVFCNFLALRLKAELERRLVRQDPPWEWAEILRGLDKLQEVEAVFQGRRFVFRSQLVEQAHRALRAAVVAVPATIRASSAGGGK